MKKFLKLCPILAVIVFVIGLITSYITFQIYGDYDYYDNGENFNSKYFYDKCS